MVQLLALTALLLFFIPPCMTRKRLVRSLSPRAPQLGKAGLAWAGGNTDPDQFSSTSKVSWYYTWSPYPIDTTLEFVPMLHSEGNVDSFTSTIQRTIDKQKVKNVLGMNEPELSSQANMPPEKGVEMWTKYLEPLRAQGIRLGSPSPSSSPSGKDWLTDFLAKCGNACTVDFVALHWYGTDATQFKKHLTEYYEAFKRPIWVTEWACHDYGGQNRQCSQNDVNSLMNETQSFMDNTEWVERYSWFGVMTDMGGVGEANAIVDSSGKINALGRQYIEVGNQSSPVGAAAPRPTRRSSMAFLALTSILSLVLFNF